MKQTRNLCMSFSDEGGNNKTLTIMAPRNGVTIEDVRPVANLITTNNIILGKVGHLKTFNGAYIVTRTTEEIW